MPRTRGTKQASTEDTGVAQDLEVQKKVIAAKAALQEYLKDLEKPEQIEEDAIEQTSEQTSQDTGAKAMLYSWYQSGLTMFSHVVHEVKTKYVQDPKFTELRKLLVESCLEDLSSTEEPSAQYERIRKLLVDAMEANVEKHGEKYVHHGRLLSKMRKAMEISETDAVDIRSEYRSASAHTI